MVVRMVPVLQSPMITRLWTSSQLFKRKWPGSTLQWTQEKPWCSAMWCETMVWGAAQNHGQTQPPIGERAPAPSGRTPARGVRPWRPAQAASPPAPPTSRLGTQTATCGPCSSGGTEPLRHLWNLEDSRTNSFRPTLPPFLEIQGFATHHYAPVADWHLMCQNAVKWLAVQGHSAMHGFLSSKPIKRGRVQEPPPGTPLFKTRSQTCPEHCLLLFMLLLNKSLSSTEHRVTGRRHFIQGQRMSWS